MSKRRNPEWIDDDAPEWSDDDFTRARPASEVLPEIYGKTAADEMLKPKRGRPPAAARKVQLNLRIDPDIVESFRQTGPGWQTRMNQALKIFLQEHNPAELH